jgi:hypothetical protein
MSKRRENKSHALLPYVGITKLVIIAPDRGCEQSAIIISLSVLIDHPKNSTNFCTVVYQLFRIRDYFSRFRYRGSVNLNYGCRSESGFYLDIFVAMNNQRYPLPEHFHIWTYACLILTYSQTKTLKSQLKFCKKLDKKKIESL